MLRDIPARVRVLLFDWDGTLADSTAVNFAALRRALRAHGGDLSREWFLARTGMSSAEMVAQVAEETRRPIDVMAVVSERDAYYLAHVARVRPVPAVLALARAQQRVRRLALVTGGGRATVLPTIGHLGMQELFTTLVTREDAPRGKPFPDLYRVALQRLGVRAAQARAFEDSDEGIAAALSAGVDVVDVRPLVRPEGLAR
ncbi:HAD family hydrolase [Streptomyces sp. NBC_00079]|uniref:HAD family hydrolase n=1 Tax=Streptomyces sp. NBC_00079 TaxID=2975644 RepID=UPI0032554B2C